MNIEYPWLKKADDWLRNTRGNGLIESPIERWVVDDAVQCFKYLIDENEKLKALCAARKTEVKAHRRYREYFKDIARREVEECKRLKAENTELREQIQDEVKVFTGNKTA
jgi:hypothetical protein